MVTTQLNIRETMYSNQLGNSFNFVCVCVRILVRFGHLK